MLDKTARAGIENLVAYVPGKPTEEVKREYGLDTVIKMASNENPLGVSPKAVAAMKAEAENCFMYPEGSSRVLREKLAQGFGVDPSMVILGNGADHILTMLAQAFVNEGEECIMGDPSFAAYATNTTIMGGKSIKVPLKDMTFDLDAMAAHFSPKTKLIFICNPNNPTGTIVGKAAVDAFLAKVPEKAVVVFDEAYAEFVSDPAYPNTLDYIKAGKNVILTRTFSKLYGLAGTRVGYAVAPPHLMDVLSRVALPFPVNRLAQAGALAAMDDKEFVEKTLKTNNDGRAYLYEEFTKLGMEYAPSHTNFIFVNIHMDCQKVFQELLKVGVVVRPGHLWGFPQHLRVSIGTMEENKTFIQELTKLKNAQ